VPPRLTVFPPPSAPAYIYKQVPAIERIHRAYEKQFELSLFEWPFFDPQGAREPKEVVAALRGSLQAGGLLVAEAPAVTPLLVAMDRGAPLPDAFVAVGLDPTDATMRSLGLGEVVEAAKRITDSAGRLRQVRGFLAQVVRDEELLERLESEVPWDAVFAFEDWLEEVDQLTLGPFDDVPALILTSAMFPLLAEGETEQVFERIFPNSQAAHLTRYPQGLDNPSTGDELTKVVIPFLDAIAARQTPPQPEVALASVSTELASGGSLGRPNRGWESGPYMWGGVWRLRRR
jgi:hypothetical protein